MRNQINESMEYDTRIKELTPGIQTEREKISFKYLDSHESQLKNEELYYRVQER